MTLERFADRIQELADEFGSANALRKAAGLSQSGFSRYLKGSEASRPSLIAIAKAANVNLLWLMTGQPPKRGNVETTQAGSQGRGGGCVNDLSFAISLCKTSWALNDALAEIRLRRDFVRQYEDEALSREEDSSLENAERVVYRLQVSSLNDLLYTLQEIAKRCDGGDQ